MGRSAIAGAMFVTLATLSGCAQACPAIGYLSIVTVTVAAPEVVELACIEGCQGGLDDPGQQGPEWTFDAPGRPASITVVGYDDGGAEVLREEVVLRWTVDDPGNPCGSSASADPVAVAP